MMPIIESIRKGRSRRIGVGIGLNALGPVSRTVLVDCNYHFLFRMKDHESLWEAAKTLVLPPGAEAILPGLEPGECLFRGPAWPDATLVQIHANLLPPLRREIHYDTLPYVRSRSLREMPHVLRALQEKQAAHKAARLIPGQTSSPGIDDLPMQFLSLACDMVGFPAAEVFTALGGVSSSTQAAIRKKLETEQLIVFHRLRIERTNHLLPEVTTEGYRVAGRSPHPISGKGSPLHCIPMLWIQSVGTQRGYEHSVIEFQTPGTMQATDVACFNDGFRDLRLIEFVHTCYRNLPEKIRAAFASRLTIEQFTVVAAQKSMLKKIDLFLRAELGMVPYANKICFEPVAPYLEAFLKGRRK